MSLCWGNKPRYCTFGRMAQNAPRIGVDIMESCQRFGVIPAKERVKKSANQLKSGPQRRPRAGGDPYKSLFQLDKWIPAFAGMTLRSLAEVCNFDFFTRSFARMTAGILLLRGWDNPRPVPLGRRPGKGRIQEAKGEGGGLWRSWIHACAPRWALLEW